MPGDAANKLQHRRCFLPHARFRACPHERPEEHLRNGDQHEPGDEEVRHGLGRQPQPGLPRPALGDLERGVEEEEAQHLAAGPPQRHGEVEQLVEEARHEERGEHAGVPPPPRAHGPVRRTRIEHVHGHEVPLPAPEVADRRGGERRVELPLQARVQ
jgi:hypothetical protein